MIHGGQEIDERGAGFARENEIDDLSSAVLEHFILASPTGQEQANPVRPVAFAGQFLSRRSLEYFLAQYLIDRSRAGLGKSAKSVKPPNERLLLTNFVSQEHHASTPGV